MGVIDIPELMDKLDHHDDITCFCPGCDNFTQLVNVVGQSKHNNTFYPYYQCTECNTEFHYTSLIVDHNRRYVSENDEVSKV